MHALPLKGSAGLLVQPIRNTPTNVIINNLVVCMMSDILTDV